MHTDIDGDGFLGRDDLREVVRLLTGQAFAQDDSESLVNNVRTLIGRETGGRPRLGTDVDRGRCGAAGAAWAAWAAWAAGAAWAGAAGAAADHARVRFGRRRAHLVHRV